MPAIAIQTNLATRDQGVQFPPLPKPPRKFHQMISAPSKVYTNLFEGGVYLGIGAVEGTIACVETILSGAGNPANSLKEGVKWALGVKDYQKAKEAFAVKPPVFIGRGQWILDKRTFAERAGEFAGHMVNAGGKIAATGVAITAGTAFTVGTISNNVNWQLGDEANFGDFHKMSRAFASGVTTLGTYLAKFGIAATRLAAEATIAGATLIKDHPSGSFNALGMGSALYLTTSSIGRAERATSMVRRAAHVVSAILGLGLMASVPYINPFNRAS